MDRDIKPNLGDIGFSLKMSEGHVKRLRLTVKQLKRQRYVIHLMGLVGRDGKEKRREMFGQA